MSVPTLVYHDGMDNLSAHMLKDLNCRFYEEQADSFSQTREKPWDGWRNVAEYARNHAHPDTPYRVLDIGCGNMRFERYLLEEMQGFCLDFTCIDSCTALARDVDGVRFFERDVIGSLLEGEPFIDPDAAPFDLVVAFGIAHHVPSHDLRRRFIESLASYCSRDGAVVVSFWQFAEAEAKRLRAQQTTLQGLTWFRAEYGCEPALEGGDYLLGWNNAANAYRYCHNFNEIEIGGLLDGFNVKERYRADRANYYAVFNAARE